jgi:hypothetical protein
MPEAIKRIAPLLGETLSRGRWPKRSRLSGRARSLPFWCRFRRCATGNIVAASVGAATPRTVLLPHKHRPSSTEAKSLRDLRFVDWDAVFDYLKSPILLKPAHGGALEDVYKVDGPGSFFGACDASRDLMMIPQEALVFDPSRSPLSSTSPRLSTVATNNDRTSIHLDRSHCLRKRQRHVAGDNYLGRLTTTILAG